MAPEAAMATTTVPLNDSISLPPTNRVVESRNKTFRFRIYTTDNWRTPFPDATLTVVGTGKSARLAWQGKLPQHYGPRFSLVTPTGMVILLDGWLNIKPAHAITILNNSRGTLLNFSYEEVRRTLGISAATLAEKARFGSWWIAGTPALDASGGRVLIPSGGKILIVDVRQAKLYAKP